MLSDYIFLINSVSIVISLLIATSIFLNSRGYQIVYSYINFFLMWSLISTYVNDLGGYNFELQKYTYPTFATFYLAVLYSLFNLGFYITLRYSEKLEVYFSKNKYLRFSLGVSWNYFISFCFLLVLIFCFYSVVIQSNSVFLDDVTRLEKSQSSGALMQVLMGYPFLAPVLLATIANTPTKGLKKIGVLGLIIYLMSLVLLGHKFSGLMEAIFYYLATFFFTSHNSLKYFSSTKLIGLAINRWSILAVSALSWLIYVNFDRVALGQLDSPLDFIYDRIFLFQGQLFWTSFVDYATKGPDIQQLLIEISKITFGENIANSEVGMQYVMINAIGLPAYKIIDRGFLYTMAFPGILLYMMHYSYVCLVMVMAGVSLMGITFLWKMSVLHNSLTLQLLSVSIFTPLVTVLFTGNFYVFFSAMLVFKILLLIILLLVGARR
jgi:hypothetical protein